MNRAEAEEMKNPPRVAGKMRLKNHSVNVEAKTG
jgi:hypothetical protein